MKKFLPVIIASVFIVMSLSLSAFAATATGFTDEGSFDSWYAPSVLLMQDSGVISGYPDGSFQGGNLVTRAELAVMFDRFSKNVVGSAVVEEPVVEVENEDPVVCTLQYVSGLELMVQDQNGLPVLGATVMSDPETEFNEGTEGLYAGIGEGEGYYTYTVSKDGYSSYKETIKFEQDACHVIPQFRTVTIYVESTV